jgi:hypothetical protein
MYFQVSDTNGDVLAEVWANSYFANNAFYPAYIGFVVDNGDATFDYLLAATAPTSLPVATVTSTVTSPVYVTETVTETAAYTVTYTTTAGVPVAFTTTVTSTSYYAVPVYRTVTETATAAPAALGADKLAIAVAVLIMAATAVFMLRNR